MTSNLSSDDLGLDLEDEEPLDGKLDRSSFDLHLSDLYQYSISPKSIRSHLREAC